ncbi:hypothetical protein KJ925_04825 [Patescibacteria group bacterium]|nr:hypothetical protein [Patescibacteria group bacterium]
MISDIKNIRRRGQSFILRWQQDGRGKSLTSKNRSAVEKRREELLAHSSASTGNSILQQLPDPGELRSLASWNDAVEGCVKTAYRATVAGDNAALAVVRKFQVMVCELAVQWRASQVYLELEGELVRCVEFIESLYRGKVTVDAAHPLVAHAREELRRRGLEPPPAAEPEPAGPRPMMRSLAFTLRNRSDPTAN